MTPAEDARPDADSPGEGGHTGRGVVSTLTGQAGRFLLQTINLVLLARLLSPQDFGLVAMVTAVIGIAAVLADGGLSLAAMRSSHLSHQQRSNLLWLNAGSGAAAAALLIALSPAISSFYHRPQVEPVVAVLSVIFILSGITTQFAAEASRQHRFRSLAMRDVASQAVALAVGIGMALAGCGYWSLVGQQISYNVVQLLWSVRIAGWIPGPPGRADMRSLFSFGASSLALQAMAFVTTNIDSMSIGHFYGARVLGLYSRAFQVFALPLQQLATPLTRVVVPTLSRVTDPGSYEMYLVRAQQFMSYAIIGLLAAAASVAKPLVVTLFGARWSGAAPILEILAIGAAFQTMEYMYYWIFVTKNRPEFMLKVNAPGRFVLAVSIVVGATFSPELAACGVVVGNAVIWALDVAAIPRLGVSISTVNAPAYRAIFLYGCAFLTTRAVESVLSTPTLVTLGLSLLCFLTTCSILGLLIPALRSDLMQIRSALVSLRAGIAPTEEAPAEQIRI